MTVRLSSVQVVRDAVVGTAVGNLSSSLGTNIPFVVTVGSDFFAIVGTTQKRLVTIWKAPIDAGIYSITIEGNDGSVTDVGVFDIVVTESGIIPPPPLPTPTSIILTPSSVSLPNNSSIGIQLCTIVIKMSDNSLFSGVVSSNDSIVVASSTLVSLARALTTSDNGLHTITITATQNSVSKTATLLFTVTPVVTLPVPVSITLTPTSISIPRNSAIGLLLSTVSVKMSDNSVFSGSISTNSSMVAVSGTTIKLGRGLVAGDIGTHTIVVAATKNSQSVTTTFLLTVTGGPPTLSLDGSTIVGGGNANLTTKYGLWEMGTVQAPPDGTHVGSFYMPMLNGVQANPVGYTGAFGIPMMMQLRVDHGGNLYGIGNDQIWSQWDGYTWLNNLGADYASGPAATPIPGPLPTFSPPYVPSPDNTSINNGTGSLQTVDGVWTFGGAGGGGWHLQLNGIDVKEPGPGYIFVDQMTVASNGHIFFHRTDKVGWYVWVLNQANLSTGPTGLPIPVNLTITPSRPTVNDAVVVGTHVADIQVTMSDNSTFAGTLSINDTTYFKTNGAKIIVNQTPPRDFYILILTTAQSGSSCSIYINIGVFSAPAPGSAVSFVASVTPGTPQRNLNVWAGMGITIGTHQLFIQSLGRWVFPNGGHSHTVKIVHPDGSDVSGASTVISSVDKPINQFAYTNLPSPVTLNPGESYFILCDQNYTGDYFTWLDGGIATTSDAHNNGASSGTAIWGGPPSCAGPLDFTYTLGAQVLQGSVFPYSDRTYHWSRYIYASPGGPTYSGIVTINGYWNAAGYGPDYPTLDDSTFTIQYYLDGAAASPQITGTVNGFPWQLDTTKLTNTTHHVSWRILDSKSGLPNTEAYRFRCMPLMLIVQNPLGTSALSYNGSQLVPTGVPNNYANGLSNPTPDWIMYPGVVPPINSHPRPDVNVPPTNDPKYRNDLSSLYIEDMTSNKGAEFHRIPEWATTEHGGIYIHYVTVDTGGGTVEAFGPIVLATATRPGPRTSALATPISGWVSSPDWTGYMGVEKRGALVHLDWGGNITFLAGTAWDPAKPAFDNIYLRDTYKNDKEKILDLIKTQVQTKGTIAAPPYDFPNFYELNDLCIDPRDHKVVYLAKVIDHCILKIDLNFDPPHCSRYAGVFGVPGYKNGPALTAQFNGVYSLIMCDGSVPGYPVGTMFIADKYNCAIRMISPDGVTVTTLCGNQVGKPDIGGTDGGGPLLDPSLSDQWSPDGSVGFTSGNDTTGAYINTPFCIRFASNNPTQKRIVLLEGLTATFRIVDLIANTVTRIPNSKGIVNFQSGHGNPYVGWQWFDIDTVGVLGPVDDIVFCTGVGNTQPYWRLSIDGSYANVWVGDGVGYVPEGPEGGGGLVVAPLPVYSWVCCFSKTRSHFLSGGFRYFGLYAARPIISSDPVSDLNTLAPIFEHALPMWRSIGTSLCFPLGARPSFECLYAEYGNSLLGSSVVPNFDDLQMLYPTDGSFTDEVCAPGTLGRFIQDGAGGTVPRREITGNDLRAICYYIRRMSLTGTYPTVATPGPANIDSTAPIISNVVSTRLNSTSVRVTWDTDKRTIGMVAAGTPSQLGTSTPYHMWSPIESGFGTTHNCTIDWLPDGVSPIHFSVISKDVAGNSVYTADQVIV